MTASAFKEAAASLFFESDVETLVHTSLHQLEGTTRFTRLVRDVLRWAAEKNLEECVGLIRARYATPDYSQALVNAGFSLVRSARLQSASYLPFWMCPQTHCSSTGMHKSLAWGDGRIATLASSRIDQGDSRC